MTAFEYYRALIKSRFQTRMLMLRYSVPAYTILREHGAEPDHRCGRFPYLFVGDCHACDEKAEKA